MVNLEEQKKNRAAKNIIGEIRDLIEDCPMGVDTTGILHFY